jgi:hypothetical protein
MSSHSSGEITSAPIRENPKGGLLGILRALAIIAVLAGAVGSFSLMLRAGHRNPSLLLLVLFAIWVLSPFVALILADLVSKRSSVVTRAMLHIVMLIVAVGSVAIYGYVVSKPPRSTPAAPFLLVPLGSWLLMTMAIPIAALISGRRSRRGAGA